MESDKDGKGMSCDKGVSDKEDIPAKKLMLVRAAYDENIKGRPANELMAIGRSLMFNLQSGWSSITPPCRASLEQILEGYGQKVRTSCHEAFSNAVTGHGIHKNHLNNILTLVSTHRITQIEACFRYGKLGNIPQQVSCLRGALKSIIAESTGNILVVLPVIKADLALYSLIHSNNHPTLKEIPYMFSDCKAVEVDLVGNQVIDFSSLSLTS